MFGKKQNNGNTTIIGRGAKFVGTLELDGSVLVEGHCDGTIRTQGQLSIGPNGTIEGELKGKTVSVGGKVRGLVVAEETLHVLSSGSLEGEVFYGKLRVDSGGIIDGRSHQGAPKAAVSNSLLPANTDTLIDDEKSGVVRTALGTASGFPAAAGSRSNAPGVR